MIQVQITTPVLPNQKKADSLINTVKSVTGDSKATVKFFKSGIDSYGQNKFDTLVMDAAKNELDELRNKIMIILFDSLYGNKN